MVGDPLVSVIMSTYSEPESWLSLSINSILNQSYKSFEFIIVNDNPEREDLKDLLKNFASNDSRITIIENAENLGLTKSLNIGLKSSRGKYVARMDADDYSFPERFLDQITFMEKHPEIGVCGTWVKYFEGNTRKYKRPADDQTLKNDFLNYNPFVHPTVVIRKSVLSENSIFYNEEWRYAQDKQFWFELMDFTTFANIRKVLYKYRISKRQISNNNMEQIRCSNRTKLLYIKKEFGLDILNIIAGHPISLESIRKVKSLLGAGKSETKNILIGNLYLSLQSYTLGSFLYCIFSGDALRFRLGCEIPFKMLKRMYSFDRKYTRIQSTDL